MNAWALDRITFKKILQDTAQKQQDLYRHFLEQVHALSRYKIMQAKYQRCLTYAGTLAPSLKEARKDDFSRCFDAQTLQSE